MGLISITSSIIFSHFLTLKTSTTHHFPRSGPRADVAILTSGDKTLLPEDERRQSLVGDLLRDQRLDQGNLVEARTLRASEVDPLSVVIE